MIDIILCHDSSYGIGFNGVLPWKKSSDLAFFKSTTQNSVLLVGSNTILPKLPNREIIVVSSKSEETNLVNSIKKALNSKKQIYCIGGAKLVKSILEEHIGLVKNIYISEIQEETYTCDTFVEFLPLYCNKHFDCVEIRSIPEEKLVFKKFTKKQTPETPYLELLGNLLRESISGSRNSLVRKTNSVSLTYNLQKDGFPLLTTKKMFIKGIILELLFFLAGQTNSKLLEEQGVMIWKKNTSREFMGENWIEGEMGPMYGYNWRTFGETKTDQFSEIINLLVNDPNSRRILMTTYDPDTVKQGVLYPCHGLVVQFFVNSENNTVDLSMYQRSADSFLGVPFNIASYALLLCIVVNICNTMHSKNYVPGKITLTFGDFHLYESHYLQGLTQCSRIPYEFCTLNIKENFSSIDKDFFSNYSWKNFEFQNYVSHPPIKADMIA